MSLSWVNFFFFSFRRLVIFQPANLPIAPSVFNIKSYLFSKFVLDFHYQTILKGFVSSFILISFSMANPLSTASLLKCLLPSLMGKTMFTWISKWRLCISKIFRSLSKESTKNSKTWSHYAGRRRSSPLYSTSGNQTPRVATAWKPKAVCDHMEKKNSNDHPRFYISDIRFISVRAFPYWIVRYGRYIRIWDRYCLSISDIIYIII